MVMNRLTHHRAAWIITVGLSFHTAANAGDPSARHGEPHARAAQDRGCDPCDVNCDTIRDQFDLDAIVDLLINEASACSDCAGDVDGSGVLDGLDIQPFIDCLLTPQPVGACCTAGDSCSVVSQSACPGLWLGPDTTCEPGVCSFAGLTAYRPRHGSGYFPFTRTPVAEVDEESLTLGPGIRINAPGDDDLAGEDDLIEVVVQSTSPGLDLALRRTDEAIRVWTTPTKLPGTEIAFVGDRTAALPVTVGALTVWVEWATARHGDAALHLEPLAANYSLDTLVFHTFRSIVMALGGEGQVPTVPVDPNSGTFVVGIALYVRGFDVHMHDEDEVTANGSGPCFDKVVDAVSNRMVNEVAIFGYSHGGGSTYDLAEKLDIERAGIGVFDITVSSYVDAVGNNSDFDISQELRRPPSTGWHANHYQVGSFSDFFLDGGPVPNSNPPTTGLNVETTAWGAGSDHFQVDDFTQVRSYIEDNFVSRLTP